MIIGLNIEHYFIMGLLIAILTICLLILKVIIKNWIRDKKIEDDIEKAKLEKKLNFCSCGRFF